MGARDGKGARKSILFIVEGGRTEQQLVPAAMNALGVDGDDFRVLTFGTHVHTFIDTVCGDLVPEEADFEGVEVREVLADLLESGEGSLGSVGRDGAIEPAEGDADWLRSAKITDFFLLFDFDPHSEKYSPSALLAFQGAFVDSAGDLGKLLLSYPMVEAYKDACALPRDEYLKLVAAGPLDRYKHEVERRLGAIGRGRYTDVGNYKGEDFARGLALAVIKVSALVEKSDLGRFSPLGHDLAMECDSIDLAALLSSQQELYKRSGEVAVICTSLMFLSLWPKALNHAWRKCRSLNMY